MAGLLLFAARGVASSAGRAVHCCGLTPCLFLSSCGGPAGGSDDVRDPHHGSRPAVCVQVPERVRARPVGLGNHDPSAAVRTLSLRCAPITRPLCTWFHASPVSVVQITARERRGVARFGLLSLGPTGSCLAVLHCLSYSVASAPILRCAGTDSVFRHRRRRRRLSCRPRSVQRHVAAFRLRLRRLGVRFPSVLRRR